MRLLKGEGLAILDFDIESRPISFWYEGRNTSEPTAIAWGWVGEPVKNIEVRLLGEVSAEKMLGDFLEAYRRADIVTGHYIRAFDLPMLNSAAIEQGLGQFPATTAHDTKLDLVRTFDLPQSQEELSEMFGIKANKFRMTQTKWRKANRLMPEGLELARKRVTADVRQHKELRKRLMAEGLLRGPREWHPT